MVTRERCVLALLDLCVLAVFHSQLALIHCVDLCVLQHNQGKSAFIYAAISEAQKS